MLKNNKGVTLIILVITVIILMILASITTYSGLKTARESRYYNAIAQMKVMQAEVNEYYEEYKNGDTYFLDQGKNIEGSGKETQAVKAYNSTKNNNLNGTDIGSITGYKYYDQDSIKNDLDIDRIDYDFIINLDTRTVILLDGIQRDEKIYYSLCEIEGEQYNVDYVE